MNRKEQALSDIKNGFSCAQAVSTAFCEEFGINKESTAKMASPFGGGMSRTGGVCGAVSGALMVIGMKYGSSQPSDLAAKNKAYEAGKAFLKKFEEKYGSISCPRLIGFDISTPEGMKAAREKGVFETICNNIVVDSIGMLEVVGIAAKQQTKS